MRGCRPPTSPLEWIRGNKLPAIHALDPLFREVPPAFRTRLRRLRRLASVELPVLHVDRRDLPENLLIVQLMLLAQDAPQRFGNEIEPLHVGAQLIDVA